jgi:hypothetical protein
VPAAQIVHVTEDAEETKPATQEVHVDDPDDTRVSEPALHTEQELEAASEENWPAAHGSQVASLVAPTAALNRPGAQDAQEEPSGETYLPAPHVEHSLEPEGAEAPDEHATHADAPEFAENVPAEQSTHASVLVLPACSLNFPAAHPEHTEAPVSAAKKPGAHCTHAEATALPLK